MVRNPFSCFHEIVAALSSTKSQEDGISQRKGGKLQLVWFSYNSAVVKAT